VKTPPHLQHPFDTHAFVSYLEKNGLSSGSAETLMQAVRKIIVRRSEQTRDDMLGKEDMENVSAESSLRLRLRNPAILIELFSDPCSGCVPLPSCAFRTTDGALCQITERWRGPESDDSGDSARGRLARAEVEGRRPDAQA
jgi:hypothetical protein